MNSTKKRYLLEIRLGNGGMFTKRGRVNSIKEAEKRLAKERFTAAYLYCQGDYNNPVRSFRPWKLLDILGGGSEDNNSAWLFPTPYPGGSDGDEEN